MSYANPDPSRRVLVGVAAALAVLLALTRFGHFGELSRLPDASWAVFFLGGLALRDPRAFAAFFGLAWSVDLGAMAMGTPADCFSAAYLFLVPAYGALWWGGRVAGALAAPARVGQAGRRVAVSRRSGLRLVLAVTALPVAVGVAFAVSNAGVFLLGGGSDSMSAAEYAARVLRYLPGYLLVTLLYAGAGVAAGAVVGCVALNGRGARDPESA